jgi:hypothetical protein
MLHRDVCCGFFVFSSKKQGEGHRMSPFLGEIIGTMLLLILGDGVVGGT